MNNQTSMKEVSEDEHDMLRKIYLLLHGQPDSPGMVKTVQNHEVILNGKDGRAGLSHKVNVMWRIHVWLLCTGSAAFGYLLRELVVRLKLV